MEQTSCPACHTLIRPTDYFCFNCGKNLKAKPPSISVTSQIILYLVSIFLPPFGILPAMKYLRQPDQKSKIIGGVAIVLTIISLIFTALFLINLMNTVNQQVNSQLQNFGAGF